MISDGTAVLLPSADPPADPHPARAFDVHLELRGGQVVVSPQAHLDPAIWRMFLLALPPTTQVVVDVSSLRTPGDLAEVAHDVSTLGTADAAIGCR